MEPPVTDREQATGYLGLCQGDLPLHPNQLHDENELMGTILVSPGLKRGTSHRSQLIVRRLRERLVQLG
jgi:hypothetical protein